ADDIAAASVAGAGRLRRAKPGEFVADELALMLREQPYSVRCLVARSRRLAADLPTVWEAFRCGALDVEQVRGLFSRLLTDNGCRLLDTTELGRYPSSGLAQAIRIRAGTCQFPTCTVPADRCALDHYEP